MTGLELCGKTLNDKKNNQVDLVTHEITGELWLLVQVNRLSVNVVV